MDKKNIGYQEAQKLIRQGLPVYCDYCQHDLRTFGLICHDNQTQTNVGDNYFFITD